MLICIVTSLIKFVFRHNKDKMPFEFVILALQTCYSNSLHVLVGCSHCGILADGQGRFLPQFVMNLFGRYTTGPPLNDSVKILTIFTLKMHSLSQW